MRPRHVLVGSIGALALTTSSLVAPASAEVTAPDREAATRAVAWLVTQQQPDGGFEVAQFPGFETPEAVLALAAEAQTSEAWSARQGLIGVQRVSTPEGRTGLDYLDDYAEATGEDAISGGVAAKLITLVAAPLCVDPRAFDPQHDGAVDLVGRVDAAARENGAYGPDGVFSDTLWAALAFASLGRELPAATVAFIEAAQQDDGGWNFTGSPESQGFDDIDTTALAVQALAAHVPDSTAVAAGRAYLEERQGENGAWGSGDPNSTAVALLALARPAPEAKAFLRSAQNEAGRVTSPNDAFGVNTFATTQAVRGLLDVRLPRPADATTCPGGGYLLFEENGAVSGVGDAPTSAVLRSPVVDGAVTPTGRGYLQFAADGRVFSSGDAPSLGSMAGTRLRSPVVGGAPTPTNRGYYLFAADGGVFTFGDAVFLGSMGGTTLNQPIVAGGVTPTGRGYYLFAADGGVFTFGDAAFRGSMGGTRLNQPIVGGAVTPTGRGYVMVASDGGVFTFGDATFEGSLGSLRLNQPIVSAAMTPFGEGYVLFAADGGVFTFGDAPFVGSRAGQLASKVTAGSVH